MTPLPKFVSFLLIFALIPGCVRGTGGLDGTARLSGTESRRLNGREAEMGRQINQAIVSSFRIYTEPRVVGYVTRVGRSVARRSDRRELPYRFTVLYDDRVYATGAPGGYVYITTGYLNFLQNEAELAAALAHEIGQLQIPDPRFSGSQQALRWATNVGAIVGPLLGPVGVLSATGLVLLSAFAESRIPNPEERIWVADRLALRYVSAAHQDPQGYLDLMSRFLNVSREWSPYCFDYLASRPMKFERYQKVLEEFEKLPLEGQSFSVRRDRFLDMTHGVREIYR